MVIININDKYSPYEEEYTAKNQ